MIKKKKKDFINKSADINFIDINFYRYKRRK